MRPKYHEIKIIWRSLSLYFPKISFISCVNNFQTYRDCVLASLDRSRLRSNQEYITINNTENKYSVAEALNSGAEKAKGEILVFCHQDVYFLSGWLKKVWRQIENLGNDWGVAGILGAELTNGSKRKYGVYRTGSNKEYGRRLDRPKLVQTLDEMCLIVRREVFENGLRFDERFRGFHMYGIDICLEAMKNGLKCYCLEAPVRHYSPENRKLTGDFLKNLKIFKQKWDPGWEKVVAPYLAKDSYYVIYK